MGYFNRQLFAFRCARANRHALLEWLAPDHQLSALSDFPLERLSQGGLECLILDFDGVMASHGKIEPHPDVVAWLNRANKEGLSHKLVILSNKPLAERVAYFAAHFPDVEVVIAPKKKPYPDGLLHIVRTRNLSPHQVLLVDDRLLTGILACVLAKTPGLWLTRPYQDYHFAPIRERFFGLLRWAERKWIGYCSSHL